MRKILIAAFIAISTFAPSAATARQYHHQATGSGNEYYTNTRGHSVHRPMASSPHPAGASARCRDGSWSFSESRRGTCSHHGGVGQWL
jgi:hypothetical protein